MTSVSVKTAAPEEFRW